MTDPLNELRRIRDEVLKNKTGRSIIDEYESAAIETSWRDLTGEDIGDLTDRLTVEFPDAGRLNAYMVGTFASALQTATVKIDRQLRSPGTGNLNVNSHDREKVGIIQESQLGNRVVFRVPAVAPDPTEMTAAMPLAAYPGRAGRALNELINYLPQSADDAAAVRGILGSAPAVRSAVGDLAKATRHTPHGAGFELAARDTTVISTVGKKVAEELHTKLSEFDVHEEPVRIVGRLDGMRGERRLVYIINDLGQEYEASATSDLVDEVADGMFGQIVEATLISSRWRKKNGRLGEKSYRVEKLKPIPSQGTIDDINA